MGKKLLLIIKFFLIFWSTFSVQAQNTYPDKIYQDFDRFGLSTSETDIIMDNLILKLEVFQDNISYMASKSYSRATRTARKEETLKLFVSPRSIIEVSSTRDSLLNRAPRRYSIESYLDRILTYNYATVTLFFDERFSASRISRRVGGGYEISISFWQYFVARNNDGILEYVDKTKKKAFFSIMKRDNWEIKLNEVKVIETKNYKINTDY